MTRASRGALAVVVLLGLGVATGTPQQQAGGRAAAIRRDVNLVSVYFTVRDAERRLVPDLPKGTFRVFEEGKEQPIAAFAHHSDVPLNLGVLLDTSTNLRHLLQAEADAASLFLQRVLRPRDMAFAVSYDSRVKTLQVPTEQFERVDERIQELPEKGQPIATRIEPHELPLPPMGPIPRRRSRPNPVLREARLYDAVGISVSRYLANEIGRKAVVILALADDARSETKIEDALWALQKHDVIAYVIQVQHEDRDDCDITHIFSCDASGRLGRLAEETGGRVLEVRGWKKLQKAFEEIAEELHSQYSLGYSPANQNWDSQFRRIEVRPAEKKYKVQARKGYFAVPPLL